MKEILPRRDSAEVTGFPAPADEHNASLADKQRHEDEQDGDENENEQDEDRYGQDDIRNRDFHDPSFIVVCVFSTSLSKAQLGVAETTHPFVSCDTF